MAKSARPAPSLIPAILALIVLIVLGYILFADLQPSRTEHTVNPPIELEQSELEIIDEEVIKSVPDQEQVMEEEASTFVDNLAPTPEEREAVTITEGQGDFVRHDGTIILPNLEQRNTTIDELLKDDSL